MEAQINIKLNKELYEIAKNYDFAEICITSGSEIFIDNNSSDEIKVETFRTRVVLTYNNLTINFPTIDAKDVGDKLTKAILIQKSQKYQKHSINISK